MAKIDGNAPKIPQSLQSIELPKPVTPAGPVSVPLPVPSLGLTGVSDLVGQKPKLQNLTGGRGKAALPDTQPKAELIAMLKEGMGNAGALPSSLQLKGGVEAKGETKAPPRSADEIVKSLAGKSRVDTGEAMMQLSAADKKTLVDGIKKGTITDGAIVSAHLASLDGKGQVALLKQLPEKALEGVKDVWRKGELDSYPNVKMAVGAEMAARTPWGKENPGPVEALRKAAAAGNLKSTLGEDDDATATTLKGKINVKPSLLDNPEATAAVLAHEGTHLHQGTTCCGGKGASPSPASPKGEAAGAMAGIAVWDQLNKKDGKAAGNAKADLETQSKRLKDGGPIAVERKVVENYLAHAKSKVADGGSTKAGDTKADWEAKVKEYEAALAALNKTVGDAGKAAIKGMAKPD